MYFDERSSMTISSWN